MATAEKGKNGPPAEPERKFPLWPLVGAVAAFVAQKLSQRAEFNMWLYWVAIALVGVASLYHLAPRKNGRVLSTPFGLDVYGPVGVLGFVAFVAYQWVKDDNTASTLTLTLSVGAFAVIAWGYWLAAHQRPRDFQLLRDRLLVAIGVSAGLGYANFGHLHFNNFIHTWDTYHYYIGAKYFPEVGYDRMYECAITADAEDFPAEKVAKMREQRIVTNLKTNIMEKVGETVLLRPEECKSHFTPERWIAFKKDIAFFRARVNDKRWEEIHHDHGYNASPVWTLLGHVITNTGTATLDQVTFVDLFDPLYLALMAAMIWWAFGPRVFAVALIMLGTNWASRFFYWTGGALLRHDWLFYTAAVVCLLRKGKPFMAGAALAYASLLRLFPGLLVIGPVLAAIEYARLKLNGTQGAPATVDEPEAKVFFWQRYAALPKAQQSVALRNLAIVVAPPAALAVYLLSHDAELGRVAALLVAGAVVLVAALHTLEVLFARAIGRLTAPAPIETRPRQWRSVASGVVSLPAAPAAAEARVQCEGDLEPVEWALELVRHAVSLLDSARWERRARAGARALLAAEEAGTEVTTQLPRLEAKPGYATDVREALLRSHEQLAQLIRRRLTELKDSGAGTAREQLQRLIARLGRQPQLGELVDPHFARFVIGGLLATVLLAGASFQAFGGVDTWQRFAANTAKHASTPLTNNMGLKTVFSSLPWTSGQWLRDSKQLDAWQPWKAKRVEVFKVARWFFFPAILAGMVLLYFAVRGSKGLLWASAAMGAGFIVVAAELTNYYYVFFVAIAMLHELRREVGMWLTAMVATCIFIMLTPFLGMSGWQDEQSVAMSIVAVIAIGGVWWVFTPWGQKLAVEPEPPVVLFPEVASAAPLPAAAGKKKKR